MSVSTIMELEGVSHAEAVAMITGTSRAAVRRVQAAARKAARAVVYVAPEAPGLAAGLRAEVDHVRAQMAAAGAAAIAQAEAEGHPLPDYFAGHAVAPIVAAIDEGRRI